MKKSLFAILATLGLLLSSLVAASPASAWSKWPYSGQTLTLIVGDPVELDFGCGAQNTDRVEFSNGVLPDGLSINGEGLITGTPTKTGDFNLSGYLCSYNGGRNTASFGGYTVSFRVNALSTPAPFVEVHSLNTEDCAFVATAMFPAQPDNGTAVVRIRNQAGIELISTSYGSESLNHLQLWSKRYTIADLNNNTNHFDLGSNVTKIGGEPFRCGDSLDVFVSYQFRGAPVARASKIGVVVDKPARVCNAGTVLSSLPPYCIDVVKGFYTTEQNSTEAIPCPSGTTTSGWGSKSINDCFKPKAQTIAGKTPSRMKFKASTFIPMRTNTNYLATFKVAGPCTGKFAMGTSVVKGKKVRSLMLRLTAGNRAGTCVVTREAPAFLKHNEMKTSFRVKISESGR